MDTRKFAVLISYVTMLANRTNSDQCLNANEIDTIDKLTVDLMPVAAPLEALYINDKSLHEMMKSMQEGRKVDAIRAHRQLTGYGLKESKDIVEKYWSSNVMEAQS